MGQGSSTKVARQAQMRAASHERTASGADAQALQCDQQAAQSPYETSRRAWRLKAQWWREKAERSRRLARLFLMTQQHHEMREVYAQLKRSAHALTPEEVERVERELAALESTLSTSSTAMVQVAMAKEGPPALSPADEECATLQRELDAL